jgi:DNA polymerase III psi subunit
MIRKGKLVFLDEQKKLGHMRCSADLLNELDIIAKELKTTRSSLMRRVLEAFCLYQNDAQALRKTGMFDVQPSVETWLTERNLIREMSQVVQQKSKQLLTTKTPDDKLQIVAEQNKLIADMINLLHKTTKT